MTIQVQASEVNAKHASASVMVEGKREYSVFVSRLGYASIATGNAIRLRTTGKTFHNIGDVATHYKRDGVALLEVCRELNDLIASAN